MSNQNPESLPEPDNEPEDLASQIISRRRQIAALQRELAELEQHQRNIERHQQALITASSAPPMPAVAGSESKRWTSLPVVVLSLVLAYGGQFVLLRTNGGQPDEGLRQALAGGMLIAGALLFGAFMQRASSLLPRLEFPVEDANPTTFVWRNRGSLVWLFTSGVLAAIGIIRFATMQESLAVICIWLISILTLFLAQLWGMRITRSHIKPQERMYLAALVVLLLITLITRIYHLTTLPYNVDGDFASVGLQARALATGEEKHIFAYGWAAIPMLGYLPSWLTMSLFGNNLAGLNASGVTEGLLIIVGVYLLGRDLFHARVGLIAAAFLTISYAHLAASRQSVYIDPVVFLVFAIYFLLVGLRECRGWAIVTSGLLTAFCVQVYYPGRIVVFIVGSIMLYLLLFRRNWLSPRWPTLLLWVLAVLVTLGPMLVVFVRGFDAFMSRTREVFILSPEIIKHMQGVYHVETVSDMLLEQARHSALIFHYYTDTGTQFGFLRPFLDPFTAPLFTLGAGFALFHWRRFGEALALAWTVLSVMIGCFLTGNPPFWARLMILLPSTAILAALAFDTIYELLKRNLERIGERVALIALVAAVLLIMGVGVLNWNTYVELKGTYGTARTRIARYLADQPASAKAYLVSTDFTYRDREFEFLVPGRLVANLTPEQIDGEIQLVGKPTLLILTPEQSALAKELQQRFHGTSVNAYPGNSPNEVAFYVFRLP